MQNSDYKKRMKASKSGHLFCCKKCQALGATGARRKKKDLARKNIEAYLNGVPKGTVVRTRDIAEKLATTTHSKHETRVVGRLLAEYPDKVKYDSWGKWIKL